MTASPLPTAFTTKLDDECLTQYRRSYRSFRDGSFRRPGALALESSACVAGGARKREHVAPPRAPATTTGRWIPSSASLPVLPRELVDEPLLATSPFNLRPCVATDGHCARRAEPIPERVPSSCPSDSSDSVSGASSEAQPPSPQRSLSRTLSEGSSAPVPSVDDSAARRRRLTFVFVLVWYFSGAFTNSSSKQALASLPTALPLTLTVVQHLAATTLGTVAYRVLGLRAYKPMPAPSALSSGARTSLAVLCLVYTLGFCLTNASFGAVNASFVDTVKAGEPITTVLLALAFLRNETISLRVALSLLPIVGGVGISSMAEASASLLGLAFALGSNVCFSARSIAAKLVGKHFGPGVMDGANLFVHVNRLGLALLLPAALALEGRKVLALAGTLEAAQAHAALRIFAFNGMMYYVNNQMNFLVLENVDTLTHGIINCGRRVANILFAIMWFGNKVTLSNGTGIALALGGGFLYVRTKMAAAKAQAHALKAQ